LVPEEYLPQGPLGESTAAIEPPHLTCLRGGRPVLAHTVQTSSYAVASDFNPINPDPGSIGSTDGLLRTSAANSLAWNAAQTSLGPSVLRTCLQAGASSRTISAGVNRNQTTSLSTIGGAVDLRGTIVHPRVEPRLRWIRASPQAPTGENVRLNGGRDIDLDARQRSGAVLAFSMRRGLAFLIQLPTARPDVAPACSCVPDQIQGFGFCSF